MPYTYAKQGSKYTVYKKKKGGERGEKVGSTKGTKEALKKYLAALHASETTNENIMNFASKAERFFMPKDKNMKFKEDLQDLYYTDRNKYFKVKSYYMDQVGADRQSADIQAVMDAFNEIERGLNEATSEEDREVFDAIKAAGFKSWEYKGDPSGEVFYAKGRDVGEAARYLRYKYKLQKIDLSKIIPTGLGAGITDNALVAIYTNKDIYEITGDKSKMKNKLKSIVKELMADLPPIPAHKTTEVPAIAAMDQMMAQVNNMTLDQLYTLGKQISSNFPNFNPSFKGLSPEETEEKLRLEIKRFMDKHKSIVPRIFNFDGNTITLKAMQFKEEKMNKKDLMEIIREVIAEEAGKVDVVLPGEGVIASVTPEQKEELDGKGFTKEELKAFGIDHEAIRDDIRYKVSGDKSLQLTSILNYIPDNPYSHKKVTENKTKMKVNQLRQIIREEISKVLNEQRGAELEIFGADPSRDFFRGDSGIASEIAQELANNSSYSTTIPKAELIAMLSNYDGLEDAIQVVKSIPGDKLNFSREEIYYGGPKSIKISPLRKTSPMNPDMQKFKDAEFRLRNPNRGLDPMSSD